MKICDKIDADIVVAMKAHDEQRLRADGKLVSEIVRAELAK